MLRSVRWFVGALASCAGYLYLCYPIETSLGGSGSLSIILASARMVFPFLDVEMTGTFWNKHVELGSFVARTFDLDCDNI